MRIGSTHRGKHGTASTILSYQVLLIVIKRSERQTLHVIHARSVSAKYVMCVERAAHSERKGRLLMVRYRHQPCKHSIKCITIEITSRTTGVRQNMWGHTANTKGHTNRRSAQPCVNRDRYEKLMPKTTTAMLHVAGRHACDVSGTHDSSETGHHYGSIPAFRGARGWLWQRENIGHRVQCLNNFLTAVGETFAVASLFPTS